MKPHPIPCLILQQSQPVNQMLETALRKLETNVTLHHAGSWIEFAHALSDTTSLIFCPARIKDQQGNRIMEWVQRRSPDSLVIWVSRERWESLDTRLLGVETCTVLIVNEDDLRQQLDYLVHYAALKNHFRQCKHLLSIAELRCQWLVDYSREPVAYVSKGQHLHANIAYLALFGFNSETEALKTPVIKLIKADEQKIFSPASFNAELSARPSHKILLTFCRPDRETFRAELRFIPSVFRGQRCVQLHLHPLGRINKQRVSKPIPAVVDPWATYVDGSAAIAPVTQMPVSHRTSNPITKPKRGRQQMRLRFQEALNLRSKEHVALRVVEPYLQTRAGKQIPWSMLVRQVQKGALRYKLDSWLLKATLSSIALDVREQKNTAFFLINMGAWVFNQPEQLRELLSRLSRNRSVVERLVLQVKLEDYAKHESVAVPILLALSRTGVKISLDIGQQSDLHFIPLARAARLNFIAMQVTKGTASRSSNEAELLPAHTLEMMRGLDELNIAIMMDGIQDITTLNALCNTPATYLLGSILSRFPHKNNKVHQRKR